jgi:hypothetical protein
MILVVASSSAPRRSPQNKPGSSTHPIISPFNRAISMRIANHQYLHAHLLLTFTHQFYEKLITLHIHFESTNNKSPKSTLAEPTSLRPCQLIPHLNGS